MLNIVNKIFGSSSKRILKSYSKIISEINRFEADLTNLSDSDLKLKQDISDSSSQWEDVKAIKVRKYRMKNLVAQDSSAPYFLGVIAQELETAGMNNLVYENDDVDADMVDQGTTTKHVKYSILYMKAVKALQEAQTRIETLEAKVEALESA